MSGPPDAPIDINPGIPAGLSKLVLKCLEKDPGRRYAIMSLVVLELKSHLYVD